MVVQSFWIGAELSILEKLAMSSFLAHGDEFNLYTYDDLDGVLAGVNIKDANSVLPEKEVFMAHGSYAGFAEWFRFKLIRQTGRFWVDLDVVCLKPFDFEDQIVFGNQSATSPNTAVVKFPRGHEVAMAMEERCGRTRFGPRECPLGWRGWSKRVQKGTHEVWSQSHCQTSRIFLSGSVLGLATYF